MVVRKKFSFRKTFLSKISQIFCKYCAYIYKYTYTTSPRPDQYFPTAFRPSKASGWNMTPSPPPPNEGRGEGGGGVAGGRGESHGAFSHANSNLKLNGFEKLMRVSRRQLSKAKKWILVYREGGMEERIDEEL